jgi:flavin-dependent dehydrogenase
VLVESSGYEEPRVGEMLPPAIRPVLARLGLAEAVAALGSTPSYGNQSVWGGREVRSIPFVFGPHGNGWHVDRARFDRALAEAASSAGAELLAGFRVTRCTRVADGSWRLTGPQGRLAADAVVDATGRRGALARSRAAGRLLLDRLVAVAVRYSGPEHGAGSTLVEAAPDGWWYSAPIPPDQTMVMFRTDADLCRRGRVADPDAWPRRLATAAETARRVAGCAPLDGPRVSSAVSHRLARNGYAERWLAVGDAAIGVDPLSSSGILRARLSGEAAGYAVAHWLIGRVEAAQDYERRLDAQFDAYRSEWHAYYALETRWPEAPFWQRRQRPML